ncbi:MAG: hypothetical protein AB8G86_27335 [Saprospiraceae bacterium]
MSIGGVSITKNISNRKKSVADISIRWGFSGAKKMNFYPKGHPFNKLLKITVAQSLSDTVVVALFVSKESKCLLVNGV